METNDTYKRYNYKLPAKIEKKFPLGRVVFTDGFLDLMMEAKLKPLWWLALHQCGIWGDLDAFDRGENDKAVNQDLRIMSVYHAEWKDERGYRCKKFYIITEHDRSATTFLLPEDY